MWTRYFSRRDEVHQDDGVSITISLRRSIRDRMPSIKYPLDKFVMFLSDGAEPECYADAVKDENKKKWIEDMQDEMNSLVYGLKTNNNTKIDT